MKIDDDENGPAIPEILKRTEKKKPAIENRTEEGTVETMETQTSVPAATPKKKRGNSVKRETIDETRLALRNELAERLGVSPRTNYATNAMVERDIHGFELAIAGGEKEEKKAKRKPSKKVAAAKKKNGTPRREKKEREAVFGSDPTSKKGRFLSLLLKNEGKPVKRSVAIKHVYGADAENGETAIEGVLFGSRPMTKAINAEMREEGKGKDRTYTLVR